jgi:gamma-glutamyl:cysteine ligase YbdK (ATP-grasp superfamily)
MLYWQKIVSIRTLVTIMDHDKSIDNISSLAQPYPLWLAVSHSKTWWLGEVYDSQNGSIDG